MTRINLIGGGVVLAALGLFWAGRENSHGLSAFWEHWWCPLPIVAVFLGLMLVIAARGTHSTRG